MNISSGEIIISVASRLIQPDDRLFLGTGPSNLVFAVSTKVHDTASVGYYGNGIVRTDPIKNVSRIPGDPSNLRGAHRVKTTMELIGGLQKGTINTAIVSAEQVSASTEVQPVSEFQRTQSITGTLTDGNPDVISLARKLIIMVPHEPGRLVEEANGAAMEPGSSSEKDYLVTDLGVFVRQPGENSWKLSGVISGNDEDDVRSRTPFPVKAKGEIRTYDAPGEEELELLRSLDHNGYWKTL